MTQAWRDSTPTEVMEQILDGFSEYVSRAEGQALGNRKYRLNLLWVHAFAALLMAPAFGALGQDGMAATSWTFLRQIPGMPYSLATILGVGGFILGIGCLLLNRAVEAVGVFLLAFFYLAVAIGFGLAVYSWYSGDLAGTKPAPYTPVLYGHLTVIMSVHLFKLIELIRKPKV